MALLISCEAAMLAVYTQMERGWRMSAEDKGGLEEGNFLLSSAQNSDWTTVLLLIHIYIDKVSAISCKSCIVLISVSYTDNKDT